MNPCPCGGSGAPGGCRCSDAARHRYRRRVSGPLLDRFDLRIEIAPPDPGDLLRGAAGEATAEVAARVAGARGRAAGRGVRANGRLDRAELDEYAPLRPEAVDLLEQAVAMGRLSARGVQRVRSVALTLADLAGDHPPLTAEQVGLALSMRVDPGVGAAAVVGVDRGR